MRPTKKARRAARAANALASAVEPLMSRLADVQARARALGVFTDDRELLTCSKCGLLEDVLVDGRLVMCREGSLGQDTGLRFMEAEGTTGRFICPECGSEVALRERRDG